MVTIILTPMVDDITNQNIFAILHIDERSAEWLIHVRLETSKKKKLLSNYSH